TRERDDAASPRPPEEAEPGLASVLRLEPGELPDGVPVGRGVGGAAPGVRILAEARVEPVSPLVRQPEPGEDQQRMVRSRARQPPEAGDRARLLEERLERVRREPPFRCRNEVDTVCGTVPEHDPRPAAPETPLSRQRGGYVLFFLRADEDVKVSS